MELGVARAYGGHLAGPLAIWSLLCFFLLVGVLVQLKRGQVFSAVKTLAMISAAWVVHAAIVWYTTIQLLRFFLFTELHLNTGAWKQEVFGMVDGSLRFALVSTTSLFIATVLGLFGTFRKERDNFATYP